VITFRPFLKSNGSVQYPVITQLQRGSRLTVWLRGKFHQRCL
jgi:hypothetical protein